MIWISVAVTIFYVTFYSFWESTYLMMNMNGTSVALLLFKSKGLKSKVSLIRIPMTNTGQLMIIRWILLFCSWGNVCLETTWFASLLYRLMSYLQELTTGLHLTTEQGWVCQRSCYHSIWRSSATPPTSLASGTWVSTRGTTPL